jgi:adenylate cyclase
LPPHTDNLERCTDAGSIGIAGREEAGSPLAPTVTVATVMFADIRSYSRLSESIGPLATFAIVEGFLRRVARCVADHGGYVAQIVGDGVLAVFDDGDAPRDRASFMQAREQAVRAVDGAAAVLASVAAWNMARRGCGMPDISVGIGINTDVIASGRIGDVHRVHAVVIGSGVNVAARLQAASALYGTPLLIGENTRHRLRGRAVRLVDHVVLKGARRPQRIYEVPVPALSGPAEHAIGAWLRSYRCGLRCFRRRRFAEADEAFANTLRFYPDDALSRLYLRSCRNEGRKGRAPTAMSPHGNAIVQCSKICCDWSDSRYHPTC